MNGTRMIAEIELIRTNHGIWAIHRHADEQGEHFNLANPVTCYGWQRIGPGRWCQRHMATYGGRCKACKLPFPTADELEAIYREQEKAGLDSLMYVELTYKAAGSLL